MGRSRRQQRAEEQRLLNALAEQRATGRNEGAVQEREALLRDISERLLNEEAEEVIGFVESAGAAAAIPLVEEAAKTVWPNRWKRELSPVLARVMDAAPLPTDQGTVNLSFDLSNPRLREHFDNYTSELAESLSKTSYDNAIGAVREGLDEGLSGRNIAARLRERLPELSKSRSELIATNETLRASKSASHIQARESGVVRGKRYLTAGDSRVRPEHRAMNGEERALDEPYSSGELYPGQNSVRCRCVETFVVDEEALRGGAA